ncbi:MAG: septal ring lytic transglycosylase RlpA family protein [Terriglobales bacterium]
MSRPVVWLCAVVCVSSSLLTACGGHKQAKVDVPPPPAIAANESASEPAEVTDSRAPEPPSREEETREAPAPRGKPLLVETGLASWYGAPYNHRRSSNGDVYNMNAMTAAHLTLPLGSTVRVINLKTGRSAVVEITDRGPFVSGRILDLSQAAAKKVDVWGAGVAMVRLEVLRTPVPLNSGGRWAVQIGAFEKQHAADKLKDHLSHRYQTARVQCFGSPVGDWWVRVRVQNDDRKRAEEVARDTHTSEGDIFLVRLD